MYQKYDTNIILNCYTIMKGSQSLIQWLWKQQSDPNGIDILPKEGLFSTNIPALCIYWSSHWVYLAVL